MGKGEKAPEPTEDEYGRIGCPWCGYEFGELWDYDWVGAHQR